MAELLFDVSAFDCAILRAAFIKSVMEDNVPEKRWRALAASLVRDLTDRRRRAGSARLDHAQVAIF
ncbi:hypothetical protein [Mesorhizobium sp. M0802]|uniref:hypothetical protein n=1 Tax=Mesorhizobium sp. M0802 TaxID=2957001 RepID=UPI003338DEBB